MDINLTVNIILIIQALLVTFGIIIYSRLEKKIRLYQEHSLDIQSKYLNKFSDNLKQALNNYENDFKRSINEISDNIQFMKKEQEDYIERMEDEFKKSLDNQSDDFKEFTNNILEDYEEYMKKIERLNKFFGELIEIVNKSIENYDKLIPVLDNNYKKLEQISDKTKELISDHQKIIKDQNEKIEDILKNLEDQTKDTITQLKSDTEKEIIAELNSAKAIITSIEEKSNEVYDKVTVETKNKLENISKFSEEKIKGALENATILKLEDIISEMEKKMSNVKEENEKGFLKIEKIINDTQVSFEKKLSEVSKKRRLF